MLPSLLDLSYEATGQDAILRAGGVAHEYTKTSLQPLKEIAAGDLAERPDEVWRLIRGLDFPPHEPGYVMAGPHKVYLRANASCG
jgi:hypothetical protein